MRTLFQMFEEKGRLVKILNECIASSPPEGVKIAIGSELGVPAMRDFTLITSSYASSGPHDRLPRHHRADPHGIRARRFRLLAILAALSAR